MRRGAAGTSSEVAAGQPRSRAKRIARSNASSSLEEPAGVGGAECRESCQGNREEAAAERPTVSGTRTRQGSARTLSDTLERIRVLVVRGEVTVSVHGYDEIAADGIHVRDETWQRRRS